MLIWQVYESRFIGRFVGVHELVFGDLDRVALGG
jgi:hypothetical protein